MSGAQREEASALDALRERLAAAARRRVHEAAPRGAALLCVVGVAMEHASAMGELLLHAARPAELAPRAPPFSLAGGGTPPSGLCSVTACDALRSEAALALLEQWAATCAPPVPLPRTLLAGGPAVLQLHVMPSDFSALTAQLHGRGCICDTPPLGPPSACSAALVCAGPNCRRRRAEGEKKEGECTRHARTCGCGTGMFYLAHQGMVLLMDGSRAACTPSRPPASLAAPSAPFAPSSIPPPLSPSLAPLAPLALFTPTAIGHALPSPHLCPCPQPRAWLHFPQVSALSLPRLARRGGQGAAPWQAALLEQAARRRTAPHVAHALHPARGGARAGLVLQRDPSKLLLTSPRAPPLHPPSSRCRCQGGAVVSRTAPRVSCMCARVPCVAGDGVGGEGGGVWGT